MWVLRGGRHGFCKWVWRTVNSNSGGSGTESASGIMNNPKPPGMECRERNLEYEKRGFMNSGLKGSREGKIRTR